MGRDRVKRSYPPFSPTENGFFVLLLKGSRAYLVAGLEVGERLTINGFKYTVPADKWVTRDGKTYFVNHLYTTATVESDNATDKVVSGTDYHRVNKAEYTFANLHVYDWGKLDTKQADGSFVGSSFGVSVSSAEMIKIMEETLGEGALSGKNLEFRLSSPSGNLEGGDVNKNVTEISEGEFYYKRGKLRRRRVLRHLLLQRRGYGRRSDHPPGGDRRRPDQDDRCGNDPDRDPRSRQRHVLRG